MKHINKVFKLFHSRYLQNIVPKHKFSPKHLDSNTKFLRGYIRTVFRIFEQKIIPNGSSYYRQKMWSYEFFTNLYLLKI